MEHVSVKLEPSPEYSPVDLPSAKTTTSNNRANVIPPRSRTNGNMNRIPLESDSSEDDVRDVSSGRPEKKPRILAPLPVGFLDPLSPEARKDMQLRLRGNLRGNVNIGGDGSGGGFVNINVKAEPAADGGSCPVEKMKRCAVKQFWKAGEYEAGRNCSSIVEAQTVGIDHVRVHPKFLHSNATSHKWALGAVAELLDNALDEVRNGATYVDVDILKNSKYPNGMLMVEDNGGGMTPDEIRRCMSLGYSAKSQMTNTIGQYGNGFKTSTMRLGADVIVFSRCRGKNECSSTQSIGMLSYTFLTQTGKEDIVVPMIDYEKRGDAWSMKVRSSSDDWHRNLDLIQQWSPYESEEDLLHQFDHLVDQGTRIVIYNLWEDEQGLPELDFQFEEHDIQIRGVNRDEKKIQMANDFPNLRHYLNYRHSLRHYAAILYLEIPSGFRITLRGKEVEHYNVTKDLIHSMMVTYRPQSDPGEAAKYSNLCAQLHVGFIKDATHHLDVQGFNVYHKNRLIKPFWRVWNAAGSDGRGVIGILEANFIQPAHDKQGFERTIMFSRLEQRLVAIQKKFWSQNCHKVGYAERVKQKRSASAGKRTVSSSKAQRDSSPDSMCTSKNGSRAPVEEEMKNTESQCLLQNREDEMTPVPSNDDSKTVTKMKEENDFLKTSLNKVLLELQRAKDQNQSLEKDLREERNQRESTEQGLRNKLQAASNVIQELREKLVMCEKLHSRSQI